jgi:TonB-dependent starch-binding outer membrane protein SusC
LQKQESDGTAFLQVLQSYYFKIITFKPYEVMKKKSDLWVYFTPTLKKLIMELKIAVLLSLVSISSALATPSYSQVAKVSLNMKNTKLELVMDAIESQSEFYFIFNQKQINVNRIVDIQANNKLISDILPELFQGTNVNYTILDKKILLTTDSIDKRQLSLSYGVNSQTNQVTGTVTDDKGVTLPGVAVYVKGTTQGTLTDITGKYTLSNVPQNATLVFSFIGLTSQEILVNGRNLVDVVLKESAIDLDEVVVIGYGMIKKASLTGSVSSVKGESLQKFTSPNLSSSLAGQLPGLVVVSRTGEPGNDDALLRIRGVNTLGDNSPLVVVDGIANRSLTRMDPATIESITVLKDASAAIYGAQAANGVILITTKRGTTGKPTIQLNLNQGWTSPTVLPKMCDAATYAQLINEIKYSAGSPAQYTPEEIQKYRDGSDPLKYPNTDWFKETIKPWALQKYGNLLLNGGTDRINYLVSVGTNFEDGMYRNGKTNYSQTNFRSNLDAKISNNIQVSFDLAGRQENRNYSGTRTTFDYSMSVYPNLVARWPNGLPGIGVSGINPVILDTHATGYDKDRRYIMESNIKLNITIPWVMGLSIIANTSIDKTFLNRKLFQTPWYLYSWDGVSYDSNHQPVVYAAQEGRTDPDLQQWMGDFGSTTLNGMLNFDRIFAGKHSVKILVGSERNTQKSMNFWAYRRYFTSTILDEMFAGGDLLKDNGGSSGSSARLNYFGRVDYSLNSKYMAEFVWRYDGSYIFPENKRFGFFPGVSLGWRISDENFWKNNIAFINSMKIRGSWGQTGNDRIDPYQFMTTYWFNDTYIFNQNDQQKTLSALRIPNSNVTWEVANQSNLGFDAQLLNGRINVTADYFYNLRTDILWWRNASVSASTGLSLPRENIGKVVNQGYEIVLGYNNTLGDFRYSISANGSYARNNIKFWDETPGVPDYQKSTGNPMNAALYYEANGVFKDQEAVDAYPHWAGARPGDIRFRDVNMDGVINGLDRVRSRKTDIPTFTGGLNIDLTYKDFYVAILFQGAAGAERTYENFSGECGNFLYNEIKDRWTESDPSSTHPRTWNRNLEYWMTDGTPNNTYWVKKSDYLRLKNVEIGYNIPVKISKKAGMENLKIYVSGQNLLTFTGLKDYDPESPNSSATSSVMNGVYPLSKKINFGLSITF